MNINIYVIGDSIRFLLGCKYKKRILIFNSLEKNLSIVVNRSFCANKYNAPLERARLVGNYSFATNITLLRSGSDWR